MDASSTISTLSPSPDFTAIKARQQRIWASGDSAEFSTRLQIVAERLCEALDIRPGSRVLDVAAGHGNASLAAARRYCEVVSTDFVPALLERGRERARAERLEIKFREADAEELPFPSASFDVVVSTFGVMFTPNQELAASELARVCKPGAKIGLANCTPEGFTGRLYRVVGKHVPSSSSLKPPALWGTRARLGELFDAHASSIETTSRHFIMRYRSPQHWLDVFKTYYGPTRKAFAALDATAQRALEHDMLALVDEFNRATDGTMIVPNEYLEAVITRR